MPLNYAEASRTLFERLSRYMNLCPTFIEESIISELTEECGLTCDDAYRTVLAAALGYDTAKREDMAVYRAFFESMVKRESVSDYSNNPYLQTVRISETVEGGWHLTQQSYAPYELFVVNDPMVCSDGRVIPQLGYFNERFFYPAILQDGREWMTVTPNEIHTMEAPINEANGRVLTYGLGLGYYAFMVSEKKEVTSVTVVERDPEVIALFQKHILPQFPKKSKVCLLTDDAFHHAETVLPTSDYSYVFCDLWHDSSDGVEAYLRMKTMEARCPQTRFSYWIENTLKLYLP